MKPQTSRVEHFAVMTLTVLALVGIVVLGWWGVKQVHPGAMGDLAKVGSHTVTRQEYSDTFGKNAKVTDDNVTTLMDYWLYKQLADENKLKLDNTKENLAIAKKGKYSTLPVNAVRVSVDRDQYLQLLKDNVARGKGSYIIVHFDQHVVTTGKSRTDVTASLPLQQQDRQYASNLASSLYAKLANKQVTFEQAMDLERKDSKIGENALKDLPHSADFSDFNSDDVIKRAAAGKNKDAITKLKKGEFTQPLVETRLFDNGTQSKPALEAYFLIVKINDTNALNPNISDYLKDQKAKLGYKRY